MADMRETTINTTSGVNPNVSAAVNHRPSYQPLHKNKVSELKKSSGFNACDPITILDDDEPDAAEISYIDLETDNEAPVKGDCTDAIKKMVAENQGLGLQSVAKTHSLYNNTQGQGSSKHTEKATQPLFRALTKTDLPALNVQAVPKSREIGFKAWYRSNDSIHTANAAPAMQQKAISQNPSIASNQERTKNMTRRDRCAPQFKMRVLNSKRKRTMGELGYDELISPAQIESPSEKLARMAKKRRKRQEECNFLFQKANANTLPARVPAAQEDVADNVQDANQMGRPASTASMVVPSPAPNIQAASFSIMLEKRPTSEEQASFSGTVPKLDHQASRVEYRATGGKGLSAETLKRFRLTGDWDRCMEVGQSVDKAQDEETEIFNIAYQYFVQKREWLETEDDAIESTMGPYHTMNEANAVAKAEVQIPEFDQFEGIRTSGWSYFYQQDESGMQTHVATVLEIHIETVVHRELAPHNQRASIPSSAFIVAPRVYIVHELQWLPTSPNTTITAPTHCQSLTHGVFTLLKKANQRASAEYLETLTGNWGNSEYDLLKKTEMKSDLDKKVRALNRDTDGFHEEIRLDHDGFAKVWVETVVVEGPRN
ncbi:MAG: hypothetical protein Q9175_007545 [Cornicularia normoerica]